MAVLLFVQWEGTVLFYFPAMFLDLDVEDVEVSSCRFPMMHVHSGCVRECVWSLAWHVLWILALSSLFTSRESHPRVAWRLYPVCVNGKRFVLHVGGGIK